MPPWRIRRRARGIDSHRRIGADAYETRYTNGVRVLVNYADEPMDFEGIAISAQGYAVI